MPLKIKKKVAKFWQPFFIGGNLLFYSSKAFLPAIMYATRPTTIATYALTFSALMLFQPQKWLKIRVNAPRRIIASATYLILVAISILFYCFYCLLSCACTLHCTLCCKETYKYLEKEIFLLKITSWLQIMVKNAAAACGAAALAVSYIGGFEKGCCKTLVIENLCLSLHPRFR